MDQLHERLIDKSIAAAISSIEIYNKPDFKYREEIFTVLIINAWELLLKGKILKDNNDKIECLYIDDGSGGHKLSRNGKPLTIEINKAMNVLEVPQTVADNIKYLLEVRDTAIHLYNDTALGYLLYTLGAASLQNYQKLIVDWFDRSLLDYNFYILPLGFAYNFKTLSLLDLEKEPEVISDLIKSVSSTQSSIVKSDDFFFVCEITTQIKKKVQYTKDPIDLSVGVDSEAKEKVLVERLVHLTDKYPFSYSDLYKKIKKERPNAKQNEINKVISKFKIKDNVNFSQYNFRTKRDKEVYEKTGNIQKNTPSIYNDNAVRFIVTNLPPR